MGALLKFQVQAEFVFHIYGVETDFQKYKSSSQTRLQK